MAFCLLHNKDPHMAFSNFNHYQWQIYIVKFWTRPLVQFSSFSFSIWQNLAK